MTFRTFIFVLTIAVPAAVAQSGIAPIDAAQRAAKAANSKTAETNKALNAPHAPMPAAKPVPVKAASTPAQTAPAKATATKQPMAPVTTKQPVTPAASKQPVAPTAANTSAKPKAKQVTTAKPANAAPVVEKKDDEQDAPKSTSAIRANRRDPFVSIIRTDKGTSNPCTSGKKCLVIGDIVLRGIVRSPSEVIAVVENPQKKTYFLHESDPVFNGQVVKITSDAVIFREQIFDRAGRISTREITKHLNTRPIA